ncbi:hypothetical protein ACPA0F_18255 [Solibacillus silvestris]
MPIILQPGYEESVRSKMGVKTGELPDEVINSRLIIDLAENQLAKRVPDHAAITDIGDKLLLEGAVISYMCYLLAPSMARRLNIEVTALDMKWKKDKVDWNELAHLFLSEVDAQLSGISSVVVDGNDQADSSLVALIQPDGSRIV